MPTTRTSDGWRGAGLQRSAGAELTYRTADPKLVAALHKWFNAQLSDHGADAMAGHQHHDHGAMIKK